MNRIVIQDNAALRLPAGDMDKTETGFAAVKRLARAVGRAFRGSLTRYAVRRQLESLSDRMLADIGVTRDAIPALARSATPERVDLYAEFSLMVVNGMVRPLLLWQRRRELYNELMKLEARELDDIGLSRYQVMTLNASLGYERLVPWTPALRALAQDIGMPFKLWRSARETTAALERLSDRQLRDIGIYRAEIEGLADSLAEKALKAANSNRAPEPLRPRAA